MNRVYMTFLSKIDINIPSMLNILRKKGLIATPTDFVKYLYDNNSYLISSEPLYKKQFLTQWDKSYPDGIKNYFGIRPVIDTNNMESFIEKNAISINGNEIKLGSYPTTIIRDKTLIQELSNAYKENKLNDKKYHIPIGDKIIECDSIALDGEDYIYIKENGLYVKVTPLNWYYDDVSHCLVCKDIIAGFSIKLSDKAFEKYGYNFLNEYLLKDVLQDKITRLTEPVNLVNRKYLDEIQYIGFPFYSDMEIDIMDDIGKIYSHEEKEYNINIDDESVRKIGEFALENLDAYVHRTNPVFNINIKGKKKIVGLQAFDFSSLGLNAKVKSLNIDVDELRVADPFICVNSQIENVSMHCDFTLFTRLYFCGKYLARNYLKGSNLTIKYKNEKELINFFKDVQRFINLLAKSDERNKIDFTYKHSFYECHSLAEYNYNFNAKTLFSKIGLGSIKLVGPSINKDRITNILGETPNIKYIFTDTLEEETKEKDKEEKPKLSKEAEHILDLAREILSIDYIGVDKESVRKKVDAIVIEYNNGLSKKETGLSLSTNNGVYTSAVIKLENLRDTLYHNFEKNMDYYDILDLISNMIKKLNDEEVKIEYEILNDLETLNTILKYSKDEKTKIEIITYLENEKQSIIDYLSNKKEIDYKSVNDFIKKFRMFLVPILTKVSGNVSKIDVMEQIKDYALNEMNSKMQENSDGYIKLILSEIDKIKQDILKIDNNYTFEDLDYSSFKTGKEIIDYLDKKYMEYYKIYLNLMENKVNEENYENSKVPLSY